MPGARSRKGCAYFRLLIAAPLLVCMAVAAVAARGQTSIALANASIEVKIPAQYERLHAYERAVVFASRPEGNIRLIFEARMLRASDGADAAEKLVRQQAATKGKQLHASGRTVAFFDPDPPLDENGVKTLRLHWRIGLGRGLVDLSAYLPVEASEAPDVKRLLGGDIDDIVDSLRPARR